VDKFRPLVATRPNAESGPPSHRLPSPVQCHSHRLTCGCITTEPAVMALGAHDLQGQAELDLGMKAHAHLMGTEGLDGLVYH